MNVFRLHVPALLILSLIFSAQFETLAIADNDTGNPTDATKIQEQGPLNHSGIENAPQTNVTEEDLQVLKTYDLALLIDKSSSMCEYGCAAPDSIKHYKTICLSNEILADISCGLVRIPAGQSRWNYASNETINFCKCTGSAYPNGITVLTFGFFNKNYNNVTPDTVDSIFKNKKPFGGTYPSSAIKLILEDYFKRRAANFGTTKPLLIAVLSDGGFDAGHRCESLYLSRAIDSATQKMINSSEIILCFCQVGASNQGSDCLNDVKYRYQSKKTKYDIVNLIDFAQLRSLGLAKTLVSVIKERNIAK